MARSPVTNPIGHGASPNTVELKTQMMFTQANALVLFEAGDDLVVVGPTVKPGHLL